MSTDAQLDFSFGRTVTQKKRVPSVNAMLFPCSPIMIGITGICGADGDRYVRKKSDALLGIILVIYRSWLFADGVIGRDNLSIWGLLQALQIS